jgi:hypothetical protein
MSNVTGVRLDAIDIEGDLDDAALSNELLKRHCGMVRRATSPPVHVRTVALQRQVCSGRRGSGRSGVGDRPYRRSRAENVRGSRQRRKAGHLDPPCDLLATR